MSTEPDVIVLRRPARQAGLAVGLGALQRGGQGAAGRQAVTATLYATPAVVEVPGLVEDARIEAADGGGAQMLLRIWFAGS